MEETLKTCRSIQRTLVLALGTLLLFAFSTGNPIPYELALKDFQAIGAYGADDLSEFISEKWLIERRSEEQILPIYIAANKSAIQFGEAVRESMKVLGVRINEEELFDRSSLRVPSDPMLRVEGWIRPDLYISLPPIKRPTVAFTLKYLEKNMLEGTLIVLPGEDIWVYPHIQRAARQNQVSLKGTTLVSVELTSEEIGKGFIKPYEQRPTTATPRAIFRFSFEKLNGGNEPLIELDVQIPMNRTGFRISEKQWNELQKQWYQIRGINGELYVPTTQGFQNLRQFYSEVQNMNLNDAEQWLNTKIVQNRESTTVFGISVKRSLVTTVGPMIISILLIYLISNILHLIAISNNDHPFDNTFPWGPVSPNIVSRGVGLFSISILPGLTSFVLPVLLGGSLLQWFLAIVAASFSILVLVPYTKLKKLNVGT